MSIPLQQGQTLNLHHDADGALYDLSAVTLGLGWDMRKPRGGIFGRFFGPRPEDYDLDAFAFLLDENRRMIDAGKNVQMPDGREVECYGGDVIYFNNMRHPSGTVWLSGDNRSGVGQGDDEQLILRLSHIPARISAIVVGVAIYKGRQFNQHFGIIDNAFIHAVDAAGREIARFELSRNPAFKEMCSMKFAEIFRNEQGSWSFRALGPAYPTDNLLELLREYEG